MEKNIIELITIDEAAELLRVKKSRLRKAIFRREVKFVKLGALIRFRREHLIEWIEKNTMESATA
ncbi:helix-turn-helix domain-containing protein [bacterium]|nr:helix-turn-helix domain-containing protein [bacterium]